MTVYGYTRLVGYDKTFRILPDLLESLEVEEGRIFTFKLRRGHKWSDGHPFTSEDFRYYWEDVANNRQLSPSGISRELIVEGKPPTFEVIDEVTVRYSWPTPNAGFLEALARSAPLFLYRPAHYLKQFHEKYAKFDELAKLVAAERQPNWYALHGRKDSMYANDNPDQPTLNPWMNTTPGNSQRYVFVRNPYFHRVDDVGMQLPYIDKFILNVTTANLIPSKAGLGESCLQARYLRFSDYTFLRKGAQNFPIDVRLWDTGNGGPVVFYPNLTTNDLTWRSVLRDVRFRRALSAAIDRTEINEAVYQGMATASNNSIRKESPLYKPEDTTLNAEFNVALANRLLDEMGLKRNGPQKLRTLPDGRVLDLIVDTAGEAEEEKDVLTLIHDQWQKIGVKLHIHNLPRENFRNQTFSGAAIMTLWPGIENSLPRGESSPSELAPTNKGQLQWSKWGDYYESGGKSGEPCDMPEACQLLELFHRWERSTNEAEQGAIWQQMLKIHAEQQFTIGIITNVPQPIVLYKTLHNVPVKGIYAWHPAAFIGAYRPDTFWLERK
jgi:peptide/nickel transport system substrate-binding protein